MRPCNVQSRAIVLDESHRKSCAFSLKKSSSLPWADASNLLALGFCDHRGRYSGVLAVHIMHLICIHIVNLLLTSMNSKIKTSIVALNPRSSFWYGIRLKDTGCLPKLIWRIYKHNKHNEPAIIPRRIMLKMCIVLQARCAGVSRNMERSSLHLARVSWGKPSETLREGIYNEEPYNQYLEAYLTLISADPLVHYDKTIR